MDYRSDASFLGLPLLHVSTGRAADGTYKLGIATGWIAIGNVAVGVLFAGGGVAIGGVCVGGLSVGLLPLGGFALGLIAVGGLAAGLVAVGGAAFGWHVAIGGLAIARDFALGGYASAHQILGANNPPWSSIPHPPMRWTDAVVLMILIGLLMLVAWSIHERRNR